MKDPHNVSGNEAAGTTSTGLVQGIKARDPEAWQRLAGLYGPLVYGWCRARGLQARDCEDVVQEVFLTVAARVADFDHGREGATFRGWLWTITRNKLGDWLRRQQTQAVAVGGTDAQRQLLATPAEEPDSAADNSSVSGLYRRALDLIRGEFEEASWQAFWRVAVEGRPAADVAQELGLSRNAVYVAKSRILRRLREALGEE